MPLNSLLKMYFPVLSPIQPLSDPVYENVLALTNLSAPAAQREPTEGTRCVAGSRVHSDQI